MAGKIKGIIVEIGGDTSGLQKALSKVNSVTSSLSKELRGVNSLLKLDPSNTELLSQKQIVLKDNIEATRNKLVQLKDVQEQALQKGIDKNEEQQENWRKLQRDIVATENKLKQLLLEDSAWNINGKKIEEFGNKIVDIGKKVDGLGSKLTKTLTTSILGLGVASSKTAIDFESAFTGVEKTVDGTKEQIANLKQGIKEMAKELPSTTTEISEVAEAAGQLGIQTDNVLSFSKVMIDMGNSTNLSSNDAATALARFANITQMSQKDFDKLGSSIVDLGNNFATTESEIVEMALRLAGAGHQVGMSEGQILGLATALSSVGIEAEMGGSALSKALVKMQNAVEMGSGKLQTVLKKLNMSLRELELSAANDSMGFKSLCDSIGMTSTEVKQLITAGTNLEDFASISGMSADQFKKAWKDDATGALTAFIKGLGSAEEKGESAITMLSEMGLTEVRLRDSLLRAANAGKLFNSAIETGTKAWEENVALTNEANKRYGTTESKLKITINRVKDLGIKLGDKLLPITIKLIEKADRFIDKLNKIDDATLENIIEIGALVAALGPFLKITSKIGTGLGSTIKVFGKFSQAIAVVKTGAVSTDTTVNSFAKAIKGLISPAGLASAALASFAIGVSLVSKKVKEEAKETQNFIENLENSVNTRKKSIDVINEQQSANLAEIENVQKLYSELKNLVFSNGEVKRGYELRANFILNQLNKALGTEYKLNGNMITSYNDMRLSIDKLIERKKAQIILEANEEEYKEAIKNKTQANKDYIETQDKLCEALKNYNKLSNEYQKGFVGSKYSVVEGTLKLKEYKEEIEKLSELYKDQKTQLQKYSDALIRFEKNSELMLEGTESSYKKIEESVVSTQKNITTTTNTEFNKRVKAQIASNNEAIRLYNLESKYNKNVKDSIYATNLNAAKNNLKLLADELISMTSTTEELTPDIRAAWVSLAVGSRDEYERAISTMPVVMRNKINEMTAALRNDISVKDAAKFLGEEAVNQLNISSKFEEAGKNWIKGISKGINNRLLRQEALSSMHNFGVEGLNAIRQQAWDEHSPSKETEKAAINLLKGVTKGINKEKTNTINNMLNFGKELTSKFNNKYNLNTNLFQNIPSLQRSISQNINTTLQPKILQPNIVINTQHLDNNEMNKIIDTVNKRLGMQM